ncbi:hypothetical protein [uncultured Kiloniella sp.]|uniref:hypothetical protein n=1 Tax=uncultured Kiloniella sp. TaxID=1133091 RepID=UPI002619B8C0|nr:hypothetical protein [uncultured Kiloniella sp.]
MAVLAELIFDLEQFSWVHLIIISLEAYIRGEAIDKLKDFWFDPEIMAQDLASFAENLMEAESFRKKS